MEEKWKTIQERYGFARYVNRARWNSYYNQIQGIMKCGAESILLIGKGDGIVPEVLKMLGKTVTTFDFLEKLYPDIVGDVRDIESLVHEKYDAIVCCEVLEHIPFSEFGGVIKQFYRILQKKEGFGKTDGNLLISLPQGGFLPEKIEICRLDRPDYNDFRMVRVSENEEFIPRNNHFWEVGFRGYEKENILQIIEKYFAIEYEGTSPQTTYHWFIRGKAKI